MLVIVFLLYFSMVQFLISRTRANLVLVGVLHIQPYPQTVKQSNESNAKEMHCLSKLQLPCCY